VAARWRAFKIVFRFVLENYFHVEYYHHFSNVLQNKAKAYEELSYHRLVDLPIHPPLSRADTYTLTLEVPPAPTAASLTLSISDIHISNSVKLTHNNIAVVFPRGATPASVRMQSVLEGVTINGAAVQVLRLSSNDE
jgi:hypothetical protein